MVIVGDLLHWDALLPVAERPNDQHFVASLAPREHVLGVLDWDLWHNRDRRCYSHRTENLLLLLLRSLLLSLNERHILLLISLLICRVARLVAWSLELSILLWLVVRRRALAHLLVDVFLILLLGLMLVVMGLGWIELGRNEALVA